VIEFQQNFMGAILDGTHKIYHNNFIATHHKALQVIYPIIQKIIGEECFENLAEVYIPEYVSESYKLQDYGKNFSEFLKNFVPLQSLPYLSDMARFEWAIHEIYYEKESMPPETRFIESAYPVLSIWELCREEESTKKLDIAIGGERVLILRKAREIIFKKLDKTAEMFLSWLI